MPSRSLSDEASTLVWALLLPWSGLRLRPRLAKRGSTNAGRFPVAIYSLNSPSAYSDNEREPGAVVPAPGIVPCRAAGAGLKSTVSA